MASRNTSVVEINGNRHSVSTSTGIKRIDATDEIDSDHSPELSIWCKWVLISENFYYRQFIRGVSLVNLIVLVLSIPWTTLHMNETIIYIQFICITTADFVLACIYTIAFGIRINYYWWQVRDNKNSKRSSLYVTNWYRVLISFGLMFIMWYSVAIGIYRSIVVEIPWQWYLGLVIRSTLAVPPVTAMFLRDESSFFKKLSKLLKWRQLAMVTIFYFIFMLLLALIGVHLIGGLHHACVYKTLKDDGSYSITPAVPFTHCNPDEEGRSPFCAANNDSAEGLVCVEFPPRNNSDGLYFNYRSYVYYGQFTVILDAFFAVYEASTLELWSFMMYTAIEGRGASVSILFYLFLTIFIVIILQQSIFLVVIIESFADLRSQSFFQKSNSQIKTLEKPTTVLSLKNGSITLKTSSHVKSSVLFLDKYHKRLVMFEKVFLVLVIIDAIVIASKHNGMTDQYNLFLQVWQVFASIMFVIEILLIFLFHIYHGQWKLFFSRPYYLCLIVLAVGGVVAAIPLKGFYNPLQAGNGLTIFQSLRFPRLLRLHKHIHNFVVKIMGKSIPILSLITVCMIIWLAVVNAQIFGYMKVTEECQSIGGTETSFAHFIEAFESTFQIVTNEAWTDVTSEVMCRSSYWFVTNFYFIVIHLFSSLIFLNFFGAVILDNLEYDEEEKKAKLEKIKKKEEKFAETVPPHLNIFKILRNKPKKLKIPPGIGKWDPNLSEVEISKFFETGNMYNVSEDSLAFPSVDSDVTPHETATGDIAAILEYIKLWRRCNEEESSKLSQVSHIHHVFGQSLYNRKSEHSSRHSNVRSEYDVFREKYQYFDMALFCMTRESKLRLFCTKVLGAQANSPNNVPSDEKKGVLHLLRKRLAYISKWVISRIPYSTWILFLGLVIVISVQLHEFSHRLDHLQHKYTIFCEMFYLLLMFSWLILKVISHGCFLNPHAAINSLWDVIDWILVLDSALLFILVPFWGNYAVDQIQFNIAFLPSWCKALFIIRSLRPLHVISMYYPARTIVSEIVKGWRNLLKASFIMFGFMFMFASLGVQLFSGTAPNPIAFCNDPTIKTMEQCMGQFSIKIELSREFLSLNDSSFPNTEMMVPRVWYLETRDFSFNNVGIAFVTLFELLTLEGWPEVRDLFSERNPKAEAYMRIYMHVFVFFAVNIGLQLFLGIVVNNFNEQKPGHTSLLSVDQNRWVELMQRISLLRPYKLPKEPRHNKQRRLLYSILTKSYFRFVPTVIIGLSALTLIVPWNESFIGGETVRLLIAVSIILNCYTIIEMFMKLIAFGPAYFRSWRNNFDLLLSFITFVYCIFAGCSLVIPRSISFIHVSYFALSLAIVKLLTVLVKYSAMLNLLLTVISTIISSLSLTLVLFIVSLCYALLGVTFFSNVRSGEAIDYHLVNFSGIANALSAIWRSVTGEDWYQIMWDAAVQEPYCHESLKNCGNKVISILYFGSFTFLVPFILLNVFIAVLLENFSIFYNDEETNLRHDVIKDFKHSWRLFDTNANGNIPISRIKLLLRTLKLEKYYTYNVGESGKRIRKLYKLLQHPLLLWEMEQELKRMSCIPTTKENLPVSSEIKVKFATVLRMLAYRCEDINKRLEPQELFTRKEQEQTLQLDVAQECILQWMKKRMRPIIQYIKQNQRGCLYQSQDSTQSLSEKRQRFKLLHNIQSQGLLPLTEWNVHSVNSEDEEDVSRDTPAHLMNSVSEDQIEDCQQEHNDDLSVNRSFMKLKQKHRPMSNEKVKHNEKVKQWYQIQEQWMENVQTNKDYFDDYL